METIKANIWNFQGKGYIIIPTNGFVKRNGECVMGAGLAKQAKLRFPTLPLELGAKIALCGNHVFHWDLYGLITFPVKHSWIENADPYLIEQSAVELSQYYEEGYKLGADLPKIYMPQVGCGNGKLNWSDIEPIINLNLNHLVTIVDNQSIRY